MDAIVTHGSRETAEAARLVRKDDLWTLAAFGVLAYMISNVLHEGLGHGGVAWLSGAQRITVTSTYMEAGMDTRWILAAGTLVNLAVGLLGLLVLHGIRPTKMPMRMPLRLFIWSFTAFNLLLGTGYFLFSGIGGIGDWADWIKGLSPIWAWRAGFALLGAVSYLASAWVLARELVEIVGLGEARLRRMTWIIYFAGGLTACLAGVRNPMGWKLVLISAAASSLGGASGLMWIPSIAARAARGMQQRNAAAPMPKMPLDRMPMLWVTVAVLLAEYVWFLGPGITMYFAGRS
ncbi:MAG: hypothetical protein WCB58_22665 [Acidobacteriaceae bacterium]